MLCLMASTALSNALLNTMPLCRILCQLASDALQNALSNALSNSVSSDLHSDLCTAMQMYIHSRAFSAFLLSDAHDSIKSSDADLPHFERDGYHDHDLTSLHRRRICAIILATCLAL